MSVIGWKVAQCRMTAEPSSTVLCVIPSCLIFITFVRSCHRKCCSGHQFVSEYRGKTQEPRFYFHENDNKDGKKALTWPTGLSRTRHPTKSHPAVRTYMFLDLHIPVVLSGRHGNVSVTGEQPLQLFQRGCESRPLWWSCLLTSENRLKKHMSPSKPNILTENTVKPLQPFGPAGCVFLDFCMFLWACQKPSICHRGNRKCTESDEPKICAAIFFSGNKHACFPKCRGFSPQLDEGSTLLRLNPIKNLFVPFRMILEILFQACTATFYWR